MLLPLASYPKTVVKYINSEIFLIIGYQYINFLGVNYKDTKVEYYSISSPGDCLLVEIYHHQDLYSHVYLPHAPASFALTLEYVAVQLYREART